MGDASMRYISHLTMRDKAESLIFKLLALDMDARALTLSLIIR